jgi:hypothetical protein
VIPEAEHVYAAALARDGRRVVARDHDGAAIELATGRWFAALEAP